jgi:aminopeptidase N
VTPASDPIVQKTLAEQFEAWDRYEEGRPGQAAFRAFAQARLDPLLVRVGWDPKPGESDNDALLRGVLIRVLGELNDPGVTAEAFRRFQAYVANPATLTGETRLAVLAVTAAYADPATWEQLHRLARASRDAADRPRLYRLLGTSHDPALARRALELALSGEPGVTEAPGILAAVSSAFPDEAFDFAIQHRAQVERLVEPTSRVSFFSRLAAASRDPAMLNKLAAFAQTVPASTRGEVEKSASQIRVRLDIVQKRMPQVDAWLAANR